jgi:predicted MFS family arabinose efflux permease
VGVSWALPLDIGGDCAGSVAALMNTWGNLGGAIGTWLTARLAKSYGWDLPFLLTAGLCVVAAALFLKIDASRRIKI